jgi:hypothetical protein
MDQKFQGDPYTIGMEEELMILDAGSLELVNAIESMLEPTPSRICSSAATAPPGRSWCTRPITICAKSWPRSSRQPPSNPFERPTGAV